MMYQVALVALAASLTALAQVSATVVPGPAGKSRIVINNSSSVPVEAFEVTWVEPRGAHFSNTATSVDYVDEMLGIYRQHRGRAQDVTIPIRGGLDTPVQLRAAIFQDGSTYGDPEWVAVLLKRREQYHASLETFLKELRAAVSESLSREELVARLETLRSSELAALPTPAAQSGDLNLPALVAAAQREGVERVASFLIANFEKLPTRNRKGSVSKISYPEALASMTQTLKYRGDTLSGAPGN